MNAIGGLWGRNVNVRLPPPLPQKYTETTVSWQRYRVGLVKPIYWQARVDTNWHLKREITFCVSKHWILLNDLKLFQLQEIAMNKHVECKMTFTLGCCYCGKTLLAMYVRLTFIFLSESHTLPIHTNRMWTFHQCQSRLPSSAGVSSGLICLYYLHNIPSITFLSHCQTVSLC